MYLPYVAGHPPRHGSIVGVDPTHRWQLPLAEEPHGSVARAAFAQWDVILCPVLVNNGRVCANSATWGALVDQRLQLSSRIRCSGLLSPEAADFVLELADTGSSLLDAGELVLVGEDGPLRRWVDPE